ncbi:hypothetical protein GCK32_008495 [Trichostrongylus colubriformis]|uniref:7TM GPCR serpentine receptor class x (Srx) domain-containing protein n=1 Tax=Trichostrongylus colubriformis TaxID=6319 RepID=A0AAN8FJB9_TRICO
MSPEEQALALRDRLIVSSIVFMVAFPGMLCNALVAMFTRAVPTLNNAFGRLTASQATDCPFYYTDPIYAFVFASDSEYCEKVSWYADFIQDVSFVILIAILDTITIIKYRITSAEMAKTTCKKTALKRDADKNLLKQTVAQGIVFAVELSTYFVLGWLFENKWVVWMLTTFAWTTVHSSDAFIIIIFNKDFRRLICSPKKLFLNKSRITHEGPHNTMPSGGLNTHESYGH